MKSTMMRLGLGVATAATAMVSVAGIAAADPAPQPGPMAGPACEVGKLCVFDGPQFTGHRLDMFECKNYDVNAAGLAGVRSFVNNQSGEAVATFANDQNVPQYSSKAVDARSDVNAPVRFVKPC
ncbi:hypothetical protein [Pseudonocardia phyllosphaerae]|uniref:hypothetical protein n=1 Tax=Pseudonocardia phyllosphaerae TaxID=3390502 RepID=UPI00397CC327